MLHIVSKRAMVKSATIFDIRGRKVSEVNFESQTSYQIDLGSLEGALYFVEIKTGDGTFTKRVLKK